MEGGVMLIHSMGNEENLRCFMSTGKSIVYRQKLCILIATDCGVDVTTRCTNSQFHYKLGSMSF